jgi:hypothetical protein
MTLIFELLGAGFMCGVIVGTGFLLHQKWWKE